MIRRHTNTENVDVYLIWRHTDTENVDIRRHTDTKSQRLNIGEENSSDSNKCVSIRLDALKNTTTVATVLSACQT